MLRTGLKCAVLFAIFFLESLLLATTPVTVTQLAELTPSTRATNDWFGISIAVSGDTVVVGDFDPNIESYGAVYVYVKPSNGWQNMTQVAKLTSSDNGEGFGTSVAISGDTIVVGAANTSNFDRANHRTPASSAGAAYVFVKPVNGWVDSTENAKLTASDGQPGDAFGNAVGISDRTIAVGAFFASDSSGNSFAGKAYVFVQPRAGWRSNLTETAELTASDSEFLNYMGASIAIGGDTVVVGAYGHNNFQGVAYVFSKPSGGWTSTTQTAELSASDGKGSADFGFSSAISGSTVVEGAVGAANGNGAAYVFVEAATGWANMTQTAELRAPNGQSGSSFGQSAGINGAVVVVGAPGMTVDSNQEQGAAYLFLRPGSGWHNELNAQELIASDGAAFDVFGASLAISGTTIVAGAPESTTPGSAYVFGP
jgi:FG-GAP repeat